MGAYEEGFDAGLQRGISIGQAMSGYASPIEYFDKVDPRFQQETKRQRSKPTRKLSAWNKFVKANSKKPRFKYKSGAKKGKLNLKAMAVAFRRTPAGKKSKK